MVVINRARQNHFFKSQRSKNILKKGYIEIMDSYLLETQKRALGSSISHYSPAPTY